MFVWRIWGILFQIYEHVAIGHWFIVLALYAFAILVAKEALLKAFTVFLHAKRLPAWTTFGHLDSFHWHWFSSRETGGSFKKLEIISVLLVVAVCATAELGALLACSEALAVEFHAFRVAAVAGLFLCHFVWLLRKVHYFIFKFKLYPDLSGQFLNQVQQFMLLCITQSAN